MLEKATAATKDYVPTSKGWLSASWQGLPGPHMLTEKMLSTCAIGSDEESLWQESYFALAN